MTIPSFAFYVSLGGSVLIQWGLALPHEKKEVPRGALSASLTIVFFMIISGLIAVVYNFIQRYILSPWRLESLAPAVFLGILFLCFIAVNLAHTVFPKFSLPHFNTKDYKTIMALYAIAMTSVGRFDSAMMLFAASVSSAFGYSIAMYCLDSIVERIELEHIPEPFQGLPIRLISVGLIALAFSGIDAAFFSGIIG